jgi:tRNA(Ser,Leu) C12 N-acetylase TAN1
MAVDDPVSVLEHIEQRTESNPALYDAISRVAPAQRCFEFHSAEEFLAGAEEAVAEWAPRLAGDSFHLRLHRRGLTRELRSPDVERRLDDVLLEALQRAGAPGRLSFTDPDAVIAIDTIDDRAGVGFWSRDDLKRHRLLRPD